MLDQDFITALIGLRDFRAVDARLEQDGTVIIEAELRWVAALCPQCGCPSTSVLEYIPRRCRDLSISGKRVLISFEQRRFRCAGCCRSFVERLASSCSPGAHYTKRYEEWVVRQVRQSTVQDVAMAESLAWETVQNILHRVSARAGLLEKPEVVRWLAFDEMSLKQGDNQYALIISAPAAGRILAILEGRTKEQLATWLTQTWTAAQRQRVEVVTIDMWDGYFYAALEMLPQAIIVIDRFHVEKNLLEAIGKLRRQIQKRLAEPERKALKGVRWLLVSNYDELPPEQKQLLDEALERCPELALCHYLKEEFRDWYEEEEEIESAAKRLAEWEEQAGRIGSRAVNNFLKTVGNWREWILNYFIERASNGFAEGVNNALQLLKRRAYGFRNFANFRLRALLLHAFP